MLSKLSSSEVQNFIRDHEHADEREFVLKHKTVFDLPSSVVAEQIAGRRKAKEKLPLYYNTPGIVFPPGVNLEQSSSSLTATYKLALLEKLLPTLRPQANESTVIDLTGGFGVDTYFFSRAFGNVEYVEPNEDLLSIARHNHSHLGVRNIRYRNMKADEFLRAIHPTADLIFIDPSRRIGSKKVFTLSDSEPDIVSLLASIFEKAEYLLVKSSPLLDIKLGIQQLRHVKNVFVVSVDNEVKELLFFCKRSFTGEPVISAVDLKKEKEPWEFDFYFSEEERLTVSFSDPEEYLYEPNAAILKAGAFKTLTQRYEIHKLQVSTHLYTSTKRIEGFPGRTFIVETRVKANPRELKQFFPEGKANITTRNYPLSVEALRKKTGLKEGGEKFLIGFSGVKEKFLVAARRLL